MNVSAIRVVSIDVARLLSTASGSSLAQSTAMSSPYSPMESTLSTHRKIARLDSPLWAVVLPGTAEFAGSCPSWLCRSDEVFCVDSPRCRLPPDTLRPAGRGGPETEIRLLCNCSGSRPTFSVYHCGARFRRTCGRSLQSPSVPAGRRQNRVSLMAFRAPESSRSAGEC